MKRDVSIFVVGALVALLQAATVFIGNDLRNRIERVENLIMGGNYGMAPIRRG